MRLESQKTIKIVFKNVEYEIELKKLLEVLKRLENNPNLNPKDQEAIFKLMKHYELFDEHFLKNINNL